ncbi:hypothetical protein IH980_01620 [Patescibacteria group bacterium]|nr:hypothetical protein [Patescibacteria group bacterium]
MKNELENIGVITHKTESNQASARMIAQTDRMEEMDEIFKEIYPLQTKFEELEDLGIVEQVQPGVYRLNGNMPPKTG